MDTDEEDMFNNLSAAVCANAGGLTERATSTPQKHKRKRPHITTTWSTEDVMSLITLIEKHSCLWEYSSVDYKNRQKRENAWRDVATKCLGHDVDECKAKWANVKSAYNNTKKKSMAKSGQGASSSIPHWPFWTAMQFYHNHAREKTTSSVSSLDFECESRDTCNNSPFQQNISQCSAVADVQKTTPERALQQALALLQNDKEDKWHNFGMYLASQMREIEEKNKNVAKKLHITIMKNTTDALLELEDD